MLHFQLEAHFQLLADRLLAGDQTGLGAMFLLPLPIHFPGGMTVVHDQTTAGEILDQMCCELMAQGVVAMRPEIVAVELPRRGRFRVWIDWKHFTAEGAELPGSSILYFCRKSPAGLRTEMVQYTHLSSPGLVMERTPVARIA